MAIEPMPECDPSRKAKPGIQRSQVGRCGRKCEQRERGRQSDTLLEPALILPAPQLVERDSQHRRDDFQFASVFPSLDWWTSAASGSQATNWPSTLRVRSGGEKHSRVLAGSVARTRLAIDNEAKHASSWPSAWKASISRTPLDSAESGER